MWPQMHFLDLQQLDCRLNGYVVHLWTCLNCPEQRISRVSTRMHIAHGYVPVVPYQQLAHTEETQEAWQLLALFSDESGMHAVSKSITMREVLTSKRHQNS